MLIYKWTLKKLVEAILPDPPKSTTVQCMSNDDETSGKKGKVDRVHHSVGSCNMGVTKHLVDTKNPSYLRRMLTETLTNHAWHKFFHFWRDEKKYG